MCRGSWSRIRRELKISEQPIFILQLSNPHTFAAAHDDEQQISPTVPYVFWQNQSAHATAATAALSSENEQGEAGKQP